MFSMNGSLPLLSIVTHYRAQYSTDKVQYSCHVALDQLDKINEETKWWSSDIIVQLTWLKLEFKQAILIHNTTSRKIKHNESTHTANIITQHCRLYNSHAICVSHFSLNDHIKLYFVYQRITVDFRGNTAIRKISYRNSNSHLFRSRTEDRVPQERWKTTFSERKTIFREIKQKCPSKENDCQSCNGTS